MTHRKDRVVGCRQGARQDSFRRSSTSTFVISGTSPDPKAHMASPEPTPGPRRVSASHPRTEADVLNHLERMQHSLKKVTAEMDKCIEVAKERIEQGEQGQADGTP